MAWYTNEGFDKIASSKMIKCPKCGTMNSASAHKCKNCGHVFHSEKKASEQNLEKKVLKAFKDEGGALGMKALKKHVPEKGAVSTLKALMKRGLIVEHPHGDYYTPQVKKAAQTATKTNPELWERSKAEAKAKMGGKHSARAMQLATQIYKKKGGGYSGSKPTAKNNSLKKWGKQKWQWSKEKKASVTAKTLRSLKDKPDEFADLVNRLYRSKGVAPGHMHTSQFLNKGGRVPDEKVESVIRSLRRLNREPKREFVPFGSDLHKQIAKDIKAGRMTKLETGTTDRGIEGIQRYGVSGPIGMVKKDGPNKALRPRYKKWDKDAFEESGWEGIAKRDKERKTTQGIYASPRGTERTRDYGPAKMEFELPESLAAKQTEFEHKIPRQIMQRFGKNIKMTDSSGNVLPVRKPFAKKASESKGVYLPAAKIKRLKSSEEGKKKLRAAERKKAKATKEGEQYSSHGLAAGTSLQKKAGAKYVGEAAILALMGNKRGLKYAEKYNQLGSGFKNQLLKDIPGTEGKYLIKNPNTREFLAEAMSHPEVGVQVLAPFSPIHMPIAEAAKRRMTGVDDVKREIAKVKSKERKKKLLDALGTVLSLAGGGASGYGVAKATEDFSKKAEVEYRGRKFPGYNKPIPSDKKNKKKMVLVKRGDRIKLVHFGQKGYEDFTQHKDKKRRKNYLTRSAGIKNKDGKLTKDDPFSPNYWARKELW